MKSFISSKIFKIIVIVLIITGVGVGGYFAYNKFVAANAKPAVKESTDVVKRGDIEVKISGTGTIQPYSRRDIVPLVKGQILEAPVEEGAQVKEGDLLYRIDDSDLSFNIEKSRNGIERKVMDKESIEENIRNLKIYASCDGLITDFNLKVGDEVGNNTKIAQIINDYQLKAKVPFIASQSQKIQVGQEAQLIVEEYMVYIDGKVSYVSNTSRAGENGSVVYDVEITINNPKSLTKGTKVTGIVKSSSGDIVSPFLGTVENYAEETVTASSSGTVKYIPKEVTNGNAIKKGELLVELENDTYVNSLKKADLDLHDSQLSLNSDKKQLSDYNITSPIDGTVITKSYKVGDTVNGGSNSSTILMVVADMSKMIFTIDVDELDIAKIKQGQKVDVTADALPKEKFEGEITSLPSEGKSSNGVTTYAVEVTIAAPGQLKPGMNVNAEIVVEKKENVLYLPIGAVTKMRDRAFVTVKADNTAKKEGANGAPTGGNPGSERKVNGQSGQNVQSGQSGQGQRSASGNGQNGQSSQSGIQRGQQAGTQTGGQGTGSSQWGGQGQSAMRTGTAGRGGTNMEGKAIKNVVVGINNDEIIEIVSGLQEGETVFLPVLATSNTGMPTMMGGFGGMPGGGAVRMPAGGGSFGGGGTTRSTGGNSGGSTRR